MISDPLYLFKNFRTKILGDNPDLSFKVFGKKPIKAEIIESILNLGEVLTDKGSLAKMRYCHQLNIFTVFKSNTNIFKIK